MFSQLQGFGFIAQAVADVLAKQPPDFTAAWNNLMKGLGMLGVHQQIMKSMAAQGVDPNGGQTPQMQPPPVPQPQKEQSK